LPRLLRALHVVSELYPIVKTGGLADVAAGLTSALRTLGVDARVLIPGYPAVMSAVRDAHELVRDPGLFHGGPARILDARTADGTALYVLECAGLFQRPGGPYADERGVDFADNHRRFAALGWAGARLATSDHPDLRADILHAHDWQAGLAVAYVKLGGRPTPRCVTTIHSIDYPGTFDRAVLPELALAEHVYSVYGVEFWGRLSFLKAGLYYADRITTVSPTYARELQQDGRGGGFEGLLRTRSADLTGILNGVDYAEWSPEIDRFLPRHYSAQDFRGKRAAKQALRKRLGLADAPRTPVFGIVSRLVWQKGIDSVVELIPWLVENGAQLAILGSGDPALMSKIAEGATRYPESVGAMVGYDESLSHLVQGGSDAILVPSRTEPCGLTQMYALRYGSPPIVRRTGGLADSVVDATERTLREGVATGFAFDDPSVEGLRDALARAIRIYRQPSAWKKLQRAGMAADFGWARSAEVYANLYESLLRSPAP
jgi:starch synthase